SGASVLEELTRFCFLLGKTATETLTMIQTAYKDEALGRTQVFDWYGRFKSGQMSIEDSPRSSRLSTSRTEENIRKIKAVVMADRRRTIDEIEHLTGISWSSCQRILHEDLDLRRVAAKMVPCLLTTEQKQAGVDMCQELKRQLEDDGGCLRRSSPGMRRGAMVMIRRPSSSPPNGAIRDHHGRRKHVRSDQRLRPR
uniref:Mos1 transposase HTH domain-containing protein n=1 Tax=Salarias fasciatus TaxID=181472 RepID=A0A672GXI9_SALFA